MQYPFPPPPPGSLVVLVARWLLVVWTLFAVGIQIGRLRNWKFIRVRALAFWSCAALISAIVSKYGICRYRAFDNNDWLMPTVTAAMSVSVAGAAMGLSKLYADRSGPAKTTLPVCRAMRAGTFSGNWGSRCIIIRTSTVRFLHPDAGTNQSHGESPFCPLWINCPCSTAMIRACLGIVPKRQGGITAGQRICLFRKLRREAQSGVVVHIVFPADGISYRG